jgi:two-component system response regulator
MSEVLYVEDNPLDVQLVRTAFKEAALQVNLHVVENAVQAFSFLVKQPPFAKAPDVDLVVLDLNLPVINGVRALTIIKTSIDLKKTRVAVFTSSERSEDRSICQRLGAAAYENKPSTYDGYLELARRMKRRLEAPTCEDPQLTHAG